MKDGERGAHVNKLQTDRKILRCIFAMYRDDYPAKGDPFIQIDPIKVAAKLGCHPELLFGRLHYDMGTRLRHRDPRDPNKTLASVYEMKAGDKRHVVNFPYLAAVLAGLESENRKARIAIWLSGAALMVSVVGLVVQYMGTTSSAQQTVTDRSPAAKSRP